MTLSDIAVFAGVIDKARRQGDEHAALLLPMDIDDRELIVLADDAASARLPGLAQDGSLVRFLGRRSADVVRVLGRIAPLENPQLDRLARVIATLRTGTTLHVSVRREPASGYAAGMDYRLGVGERYGPTLMKSMSVLDAADGLHRTPWLPAHFGIAQLINESATWPEATLGTLIAPDWANPPGWLAALMVLEQTGRVDLAARSESPNRSRSNVLTLLYDAARPDDVEVENRLNSHGLDALLLGGLDSGGLPEG